MFSRFFIDRPIFATVLAILMILAGVITVKTLPVAQYPDITPPTVQVNASYPGADAKTVAETVGVPIEEAVNGVEGMMYMSSTSGSDGSYNLTVTFENDVDIDDATIKVQNLVSRAEPRLPSAVTRQGIDVMSESTSIMLFVALEGDERYDALYLTNYAQLHIVDALTRLPGVGGVNAFGAGEYSMRIWLDPDAMNIRGITPADIISAIEAQNMEVSAGTVGAPPVSTPDAFQFTLTSKGRLTTPAGGTRQPVLRRRQPGVRQTGRSYRYLPAAVGQRPGGCRRGRERTQGPRTLFPSRRPLPYSDEYDRFHIGVGR